jgi:predicted Rossmann fold nucleotide-binding protein DprA/Smf involved in DNA uptake
MRLIIAGGRDFDDYNLLCDKVTQFIGNESDVTIISGLARGTDTLGCRFAEELGYGIEGFAAEWHIYGRSAGIRRNKYMAKNADSLIAFWDGKSAGTMHMIDFAHELGLKVEVVHYE